MHQEWLSFHHLNKCLRVAQWLCRHVAVDVVTGNVLRPILPLLDEELAVDTKLLKSHHSHRNAKAAVARDDLARTMNGLRHVEQKVDCLRVPLRLVLAQEGPSPAGLLRVILSLDGLDPPHDWLPAVAVRDRMIEKGEGSFSFPIADILRWTAGVDDATGSLTDTSRYSGYLTAQKLLIISFVVVNS